MSKSDRLTGDAAWQAHMDDLERRNAATKQSAHDHASTHELAVIARERRMQRDEELQLQALNQRIARGAQRSAD